MTEYLVVYELEGDSWGAYSPDLPGCVAAAASREEVETLMAEAVQCYLEYLRDEGLPVPGSSHAAGYVAA